MTLLMYLPLAAEGLARTIEEITVAAFSTSFSGEKLSLPTGTCTRLVLSARNSTLPALISFTAEATSKVTVPVLGIRHQALGAEHLTQPADHLHHVRRGDEGVESGPIFLLDLFDHLFAAHEIGASFLGFFLAVAGGDHSNGLAFTQAVRQNDRSADHLVGVTGVHTQAHGEIDGFVKLGVLYFLQEADCLCQWIRRLRNSGARVLNILAGFFCHFPLVSHRSCLLRFAENPERWLHLERISRQNRNPNSNGPKNRSAYDGRKTTPDTSVNHNGKATRMQVAGFGMGGVHSTATLLQKWCPYI